MGLQDYFQGLVSMLQKFREANFLCDTVLVTDDQRELKAHSVVLAAASSVFQAAFKAAADRGPGPLQVNLREYSGDIVEIALHFMYTGQLGILPATYADQAEWSRLVGVLERLGLDMKLIGECRPTFCEQHFEVKSDADCKIQTMHHETGGSAPLHDATDLRMGIQHIKKPNEKGANCTASSSRRKAHRQKSSNDSQPKKSKSSSTNRKCTKDSKAFEPTTPTEINSNQVDGGTGSVMNGIAVAEISPKVNSDGKKRTVFMCELCGRSFGKKERLTLHERTHTGERPYACDTCGRRFALIGNLRRHLPMHTAHKPFMCELCGRTFIRKAYLDDHLAVHRTAHPYACGQCEKRFNSAGQLRLHQRWVHEKQADGPGRSTHPCDVCGKSFSSRSNLKTHSRTHTGERPFVCACGKAYSQRVQLLQHARVHSDERPFQCEHCSRSFRFRGSLVVHVRSHTGERPHVCELCGKGYTNKTSLRLHTARLHDTKMAAPIEAVVTAAAAAAYATLPDMKLT